MNGTTEQNYLSWDTDVSMTSRLVQNFIFSEILIIHGTKGAIPLGQDKETSSNIGPDVSE